MKIHLKCPCGAEGQWDYANLPSMPEKLSKEWLDLHKPCLAKQKELPVAMTPFLAKHTDDIGAD